MNSNRHVTLLLVINYILTIYRGFEINLLDTSEIRYTLNPLFGFLFTVEGAEKFHFVWELLDSHATYIWSIERTDIEINILFKSIEEFINKIREIGRDEYKKTYRKSKDRAFTFNVIDHDIITKSTNIGFIKWQTKLNELLK